jgi:hypothetical protein
MGSFSIWHWIVFSSVVLIPVGAYLWFGRRSPPTDYRPLRIISPTLNFFVVVAFVGRPILEHLKKYQSVSDSIPPLLLVPLILFFLVSVYVSVGVTAYFFYRAMRNVNFFARASLLTPSSAWLMVVPLANMIAMPYVWGRTYYCSRALHPTHQVSKLAAATIAIGSFLLILIGLATGIMSDNQATWPPGYDGLSLTVIAMCTSTAGTMLFTRIVQRISAVQELYAERVALVPPRRNRQDDSINAGVIDLLKSAVFGACLGLASFAAAWPSVASSALQHFLVVVAGQVTRIEQAQPTREQILQATADELNKTVPQQIDPVTRLDRARVEGDRFVYEYTLSASSRLNPDAIGCGPGFLRRRDEGLPTAKRHSGLSLPLPER